MSRTIHANTRLNKALDLHPQVLDYIISLNPHDFQRLHNPLMRRLMSPRITLGRIAKMTHVPLAELLAHLAALSGANVEADVVEHDLPQSPAEPPRWVVEAPPDIVEEVNLLLYRYHSRCRPNASSHACREGTHPRSSDVHPSQMGTSTLL
jgi:Domain of unknown function (DUF1858)